eukprot:g4596.t1
MSVPCFQPTPSVSQFMALTGTDVNHADFCLDAANGDLNSAISVLVVVGHLKFQDKPPEEYLEQKSSIDLPTLAVIGTALSFLLVDRRIYAHLTTGLMVLATIGSFFAKISDFFTRRPCPRGERQWWMVWQWE